MLCHPSAVLFSNSGGNKAFQASSEDADARRLQRDTDISLRHEISRQVIYNFSFSSHKIFQAKIF